MIRGFLVVFGFGLLLWWVVVNPHTAAEGVRGFMTFLSDLVHNKFAPRPAG